MKWRVGVNVKKVRVLEWEWQVLRVSECIEEETEHPMSTGYFSACRSCLFYSRTDEYWLLWNILPII